MSYAGLYIGCMYLRELPLLGSLITTMLPEGEYPSIIREFTCVSNSVVLDPCAILYMSESYLPYICPMPD